jgi:hypothetical protein
MIQTIPEKIEQARRAALHLRGRDRAAALCPPTGILLGRGRQNALNADVRVGGFNFGGSSRADYSNRGDCYDS